MIKPSLNCNKVFRVQVEKFLSISFHKKAMETIKYCPGKKNTCFMVLILIYDSNEEKPK